MHFRVSFESPLPEELVAEFEKASVYASHHLRSLRVTGDRRGADMECADGTQNQVADKVQRFAQAMVRGYRSLGEAETLSEGVRRDLGPIVDATDELVKRKWVRPLAHGQVGLAGGALAARRFIDGAVRTIAHGRFGAADEDYPVLIDPNVLVRCGYLSSFPQSTCLVAHLVEDFDSIEAFRAHNTDVQSLHVNDAAALTHAHAALRPAVCLPVYQALQGATLPASGVVVTTEGKAFRYESSNMTGLKRLWDFSMREIVFVASKETIDAQREAMVETVTTLMSAWDIAFRLVSAADPFFATVRGAKALWQRGRSAKYEVMVDVGTGSLAAASINFAGALYGNAFGIATHAGETASTACMGFGMERLVLALFSQHGFEPHRWPVPLREVVFG